MIVDIRDTNQWRKDGIKDSICIPIRHIPDNLDMLAKQDKVIFVCHTGLHSRRIAYKYRDVLNAEGRSLSG
jgi:rhodanese-related sulfurtransferase